ncbi:MAG: AMP-binding protein, partial [Kiritimatiellia bacterium]
CNPVGTPSLARLLKREKILCLFAVPRLLTDLAQYLRREMAASYGAGRFERLFVIMTNRKSWRRIVAFRRVHSFLGWRFWAFVVGGAATDPETIEFWRRLGYVVLQGYGLTETAPIVTVNNPFGPSLYSVGRPVGGQDVRLAPDGEILVRGENVTVGYFDDSDRTQQVFENGWFKTGDIGEFDEFGHLHIKGRKKDMIVTDEGMNVFPEEVERELNRHPLVRDSCVVGRRLRNRLVLHAVLLLRDPATDPERIIQEVNPRLEVHQKLASASVWSFPDFPRTPTQKVKRGEVERVLAGAALSSRDTKEADRLEAIVEVLGQGAATVPENAQLEKDLGLSSLDRVELACLVEERLGIQVDDTAIHAATSVAELKRLIETAPREGRPIPFPWWPRWWPVRMFRVAALHGLGFPILRTMCRVEARFFCDVNKLRPPLIFISNHTSHLDTPAILRALPYHLRVRLAPAMTTKYFAAYIEKERHPFWERTKTGLAVRFLFAMGNVYFLPPTAGFRQTLEHTGRLVAAGYCPLVYPEGQISLTGRIDRFKPGIGMMVRAMQVPVVPIFVTGLAEILPPAARWPRRRGKGTVVFGSPLTFSTQTNEEIARTLESAVRHLAETIYSSGAVSALF